MRGLQAGMLILAFLCLQTTAAGYENNDFEKLLKPLFSEKHRISILEEGYALNPLENYGEKIYEIEKQENLQKSEKAGAASEPEVKEKLSVRLITGHGVLAGVTGDGSVRVLSVPEGIEVAGKHAIPRGLDLQKVDRNIFNVEYLVREGYAGMREYPLIVIFKPEKSGEAAKAIGKTKIVREFSIIPAYAVRISLGDEFYKLLESDAVEKIWLDYKGHS